MVNAIPSKWKRMINNVQWSEIDMETEILMPIEIIAEAQSALKVFYEKEKKTEMKLVENGFRLKYRKKQLNLVYKRIK